MKDSEDEHKASAGEHKGPSWAARVEKPKNMIFVSKEMGKFAIDKIKWDDGTIEIVPSDPKQVEKIKKCCFEQNILLEDFHVEYGAGAGAPMMPQHRLRIMQNCNLSIIGAQYGIDLFKEEGGMTGVKAPLADLYKRKSSIEFLSGLAEAVKDLIPKEEMYDRIKEFVQKVQSISR